MPGDKPCLMLVVDTGIVGEQLMPFGFYLLITSTILVSVVSVLYKYVLWMGVSCQFCAYRYNVLWSV